jgi:hypothetical protein
MKIKQTIKQSIVGIFLVFGLIVVATPSVNAAECGGVPTSVLQCEQSGEAICPDGAKIPADQVDLQACSDGSKAVVKLEDNGIWGILLVAINILTAGIGVVAIGGIVYASIMYTTAGGNAEQTKKAMGIITNIVIGVLAFALMFALLNFLIPGGLFN